MPLLFEAIQNGILRLSDRKWVSNVKFWDDTLTKRKRTVKNILKRFKIDSYCFFKWRFSLFNTNLFFEKSAESGTYSGTRSSNFFLMSFES